MTDSADCEAQENVNFWLPQLSARISERVGESPQELNISVSGQSCPDLLRLDNGDYIVVGVDVTDRYREELEPFVKVASHETVVAIPQATLESAVDALTAG